jgi:hypothetical protein
MPDADVAQFDGVTFTYTATAEKIAAIKRMNPNIVVLYYRAAWGTWNYEENWSAINRHEDWFAHGTDRVTRLRKGANFYVMNLGNPAYRAYIINYIVNMVNSRGFDGAFIDGPVTTLKDVWTTPGPTGEFRFAWHDNAATFLRELKAALGTRRLITNTTRKGADYFTRAGWLYPDPDWDDDDFLPAVDGTMFEGFAHAPWEPHTHAPRVDQWNKQQGEFQRNVTARKAVYALSGVSSGTAAERRRWALFSYGSFLLRTDRQRSWFLWTYPGAGDTARSHLFPELDIDLGVPAEGPELLPSGVWNRDFAAGRVLVNASTSARTVDLGGSFRTPEGTRVTRVTLGAWTATVLRE